MCNCPDIDELGDWEPTITAADEAYIERGGIIAAHCFVDPLGRFVPTHAIVWHHDARHAQLWANAHYAERRFANMRQHG